MTATETEKPQAPSEPMLEFQFPPAVGGQVDARTLMRWCTHKPLLKEVEKYRFRDPRLFIVVRGPSELRDGSYSDTQWEDTAAYCVPLTAEMHYVYFHRPGLNEVRAVVVDYADRNTRKWVRRHLEIPRERVSGLDRYMFLSLFTDGGQFSSRANEPLKYFATDAVEQVTVDADLFAQEPPAWLKNFKGLYYKGKPYDVCDLRSQVIGSCVRAVLYSTLGTLLRLFLLLLGAVLGLRDMNPKAILTPWRPHPQQILRDSTSVWFEDEYENFQLSPLNLINPIVLSVAPALSYGVAKIHVGKKGHRHEIWPIPWWHCVAWIDGVIVGLVAVVLLCIGLVVLFGWLGSVASSSKSLQNNPAIRYLSGRFDDYALYRQNKREERKKRYQEKEAARQTDIQVQLTAMTCRLEAADVSIEALPKEKQTVRLRATSAVKLKFCKPYAR